MGREIRRVPPNWKHPKEVQPGINGPRLGDVQMYDRSYEDARREWIDGLIAHDPAQHEGEDYWEAEGPPPDRKYYRPWKDSEATWYQLWQNVGEGSPVSPPFESLQLLIDYLAGNGDFWDQNRNPGNSAWGYARAKAFCADGNCPSFMMIDGEIIEGTAIAEKLGLSNE